MARKPARPKVPIAKPAKAPSVLPKGKGKKGIIIVIGVGKPAKK